jgi:hypothetical protein
LSRRRPSLAREDEFSKRTGGGSNCERVGDDPN